MATAETTDEQEVRDQVCGAVARKVLRATGRACANRSVHSVADQLEDEIEAVTVERSEMGLERGDGRDFIDLTLDRPASAGRMFLILQRNGFSPEALRGNWEEGRVVFQYKR